MVAPERRSEGARKPRGAGGLGAAAGLDPGTGAGARGGGRSQPCLAARLCQSGLCPPGGRWRNRCIGAPPRPRRSSITPDMSLIDGKTILVTGGTGSFGTRLHRDAAGRARAARGPHLQPRRAQAVRAAAPLRRRDPPALSAGRRSRPAAAHPRHPRRRRDRPRGGAQAGPGGEYNPFEAVQTNVVGAENVVSAAIDNDVPRTLALSHRQGRQPGQPLRRDEALRGEDRHPGQRLRGRQPGALRQRCATATSSAAAAR